MLNKTEFNGRKALIPKVKSTEAPNLQIMERKAKYCSCGSGKALTTKLDEPVTPFMHKGTNCCRHMVSLWSSVCF